MANQKPKKSGKKPVAKPEPKKEVKEVEKVKEVKEAKVEKPVVVSSAASYDAPMKGFFARKCDKDENILTIFKTPKIWGALIGEVIGTMLLTMLFLTLGLAPLYLWIGMLAVMIATVGISGANLNPLVTAGMMATRRMSAIRGVLYLLAQLLGGWIGLIIVNAFRLGSETTYELPMMNEVSADLFWPIALIELLGAAIIGFVFARSLRYARKQPMVFAFAVTSAFYLALILATVVEQSFYALTGNTFMFNPVIALMYQVLPTSAENFGELAGAIGLALGAYVAFPVVGGVLGFYISDIATRLSMGGYFCECDEGCCCNKDVAKK